MDVSAAFDVAEVQLKTRNKCGLMMEHASVDGWGCLQTAMDGSCDGGSGVLMNLAMNVRRRFRPMNEEVCPNVCVIESVGTPP